MTRRNQHDPPELRERAVRMVFEVTSNYDSQWAAINAVAQKLGVGSTWVADFTYSAQPAVMCSPSW
jgi:hypothetical protein